VMIGSIPVVNPPLCAGVSCVRALSPVWTGMGLPHGRHKSPAHTFSSRTISTQQKICYTIICKRAVPLLSFFIKYQIHWFFFCLTPLSTIFRLYRGGQFYWWRKPDYLEKTIKFVSDWRQVSGFLYATLCDKVCQWLAALLKSK
jgi:hypothetical protein